MPAPPDCEPPRAALNKLQFHNNLNAGLEAPTAPVHVRLTSPSGEVWEHGDPAAEQRVSGPAWDFALLVTQRRHRDDLALEAVGPEIVFANEAEAEES